MNSLLSHNQQCQALMGAFQTRGQYNKTLWAFSNKDNSKEFYLSRRQSSWLISGQWFWSTMLVNQLIETTTFDIYVSTRRHQTWTKWLVQWQVDWHVICLFAGRQVSYHCLLLMTRSDDFLLTYFINSFINSSMQQSHLTEIVYFRHKISRSTIPLLFDVPLINSPRHWENVGTVLPRLCTTRLRFSSFI